MTKHMTFPQIENAPVFALHSSASSSAQWDQLKEELEGRFDVITPDLPGYGRNETHYDFTHSGMAMVAAPIIKQITRFGEKVHLVGHSFGAAVCLKIALMRPDLVKSLTIYEPASFHFLNHGDQQDQNLLSEITQISETLKFETVTGRPDAGMKTFIDFWNGAGVWESISQRGQEKLAAMAPSVISNFICGFTETWALEELNRLNIPTLIMMGMDSPSITQRVAHLVARAIPEAKLAILPDLGHMAPVTNPEWVIPRIYDHIAHTERPVKPFAWPEFLAA